MGTSSNPPSFPSLHSSPPVTLQQKRIISIQRNTLHSLTYNLYCTLQALFHPLLFSFPSFPLLPMHSGTTLLSSPLSPKKKDVYKPIKVIQLNSHETSIVIKLQNNNPYKRYVEQEDTLQTATTRNSSKPVCPFGRERARNLAAYQRRAP